MANIATLVVSLGANSAKLVQALKTSSLQVGKWAAKMKEKAQAVAGFFRGIGSAIAKIGKLALGATAGVAAFFTAMTLRANTLRELDSMSRAIGVNAEELQKWGIAAKSVGVDQDKMGDILKDVADKINDYLITGGGSAADLFEKLNLDAKEFVGLSPDKALVKIGKAMDGLTQGEKVFFMEAMASDASLLLPLLENNAAGFKQLGTAAEQAGKIMTTSQIAAAAQFSGAMGSLLKTVDNFWTMTTANLSAPFAELITFVEEEVINGMFGGMQKAAQTFARFILDAAIWGVKGFANLAKSLGQIDTLFLRLQKKLLELKIGWGEFWQTFNADKQIRDLLGLETGFRTQGEFDLSRAKRQLEEIQRDISLRVDTDFDSKSDSLIEGAEALSERMERAFQNTLANGNDPLIGATGELKGATENQTAAANRLASAMERQQGDTGAVDWNKITQGGDKYGLKSSDIFETKAANLYKAIRSGESTTSVASRLADLDRTIKALPRAGGYDKGGMYEVLERLQKSALDRNNTVMPDRAPLTRDEYIEQIKGLDSMHTNISGMTDQILKGVEESTKAAQSSGEAIKSAESQIMNKLNKSPEPMGELNINMQTDAGKLTGKLFGFAGFVSRLKQLNEQSNRNTANAVN